MRFKIHFRILNMIKIFSNTELLGIPQNYWEMHLSILISQNECWKLFYLTKNLFTSLPHFYRHIGYPFFKNKYSLQNYCFTALIQHRLCQVLEYLWESLAMPDSFFFLFFFWNDRLHGFVGCEFLNPSKIHVLCTYQQEGLSPYILVSKKKNLSLFFLSGFTLNG